MGALWARVGILVTMGQDSMAAAEAGNCRGRDLTSLDSCVRIVQHGVSHKYYSTDFWSARHSFSTPQGLNAAAAVLVVVVVLAVVAVAVAVEVALAVAVAAAVAVAVAVAVAAAVAVAVAVAVAGQQQ